MATKKLMETTIPTMFQRALDDEFCGVIDENTTASTSIVFFESVTKCLAAQKRKDIPCAFVFSELNGTFICGAVVEYHDGGDNAGDNWSYIWTFDKSDIPENAYIISMDQIMTHSYFNAVSFDKYHRTIKPNFMVSMNIAFIKILSQWLTDNASKDDEMVIVQDGVFEAKVTVEGEDIIKSLAVSGELKSLIKDDAKIEK